MLKIVKSTYYGIVYVQWVNWAFEYIGEKDRYKVGDPYTVRGFWALYEACNRFLEKNNVDKCEGDCT